MFVINTNKSINLHDDIDALRAPREIDSKNIVMFDVDVVFVKNVRYKYKQKYKFT